MAFNVRFFGYRGIRQLKHLHDTQFSSDAIYLLEEPYEWAQITNLNGDVMTPVFAPVVNDKALVLRIEVPNGCAIRYEINPPSRAVNAGNNSPLMVGSDNFPWAQGYSVSVVDAAGHP